MGNATKGIVVYDSEIKNGAGTVKSYCEELASMIAEYCSCVKGITETAVQDTKIRNRLAKLTERMSALQEPLLDVGDSVQNLGKTFIKDIDEADQFLY